MSELLALGISHKTAPVALRERLAFTESEAVKLAQRMTATAEVREAVALSTCNRTELYLVVGDPVRAETDALGMLARHADIRPTELAQEIYSPRNCDAARHLYRVTAGLESMILGEAEIQGQVKRAFEAALQAGCTGPLSNRLWNAALTAGKRVRSETGIGSSHVSVPSAAVGLAVELLGDRSRGTLASDPSGETPASNRSRETLASNPSGETPASNRSRETLASDPSPETPASDSSREPLASGEHPGFDQHPRSDQLRSDQHRSDQHPPSVQRERHVLIIGAGETAELTARALADRGAGTIFVANRHADRARSLAQRFGGSVVGLDGLPEQLTRADIVVSSTSSPHPIVGYDELQQVLSQREGRPLLLIDIAVPRDIEARCGELEGVTLYDIDDLQQVVARNLDTRAGEVPRAEAIVEEEIQRFAGWLGQLDALPTVSALREHGDAIVAQVLAENEGRWESASPRDLVRIEALARSIANRILHEPTIRLRSLSEARSHASLQLVRELFALHEDDAEEGAPAEDAPSHATGGRLAEVHDLRRHRKGSS